MTNNKQQTAVEWLEGQIIKFHYWKRNPEFDEDCFDEIELHKSIQQAKEMEKQRIIEFTNEWFEEYQCGLDNFKNPEQYYNETFGGGEQ
jgi:hypothetical protein